MGKKKLMNFDTIKHTILPYCKQYIDIEELAHSGTGYYYPWYKDIDIHIVETSCVKYGNDIVGFIIPITRFIFEDKELTHDSFIAKDHANIMIHKRYFDYEYLPLCYFGPVELYRKCVIMTRTDVQLLYEIFNKLYNKEEIIIDLDKDDLYSKQGGKVAVFYFSDRRNIE